MLVSGGKILAIDQVYTDNRTISGDGVQKPLGVKTDIIATNATVSSVSSTLEQQINSIKTNQTIVSAGSSNVTVSAIPSGDNTVIYTVNVQEGAVNIAGASGVSAKYDNGTWTIGLSADYVSSSDFNQFKTDVNTALEQKQDVSAMTAYAQSAWVDENYQKKGKYVTSADTTLAGKQLVLKDNEWQELTETDWTDKIAAASAAAVTSAKQYTDNKLEDYYKQTETSSRDELTEEFAKYQLKGDYLSANALNDLSGKWESVYNTTVTASGNWNEASAFAANSAKFVTSAGVEFDPTLAYFLKKSEENVAWSGVDLSDLGKTYQISSLTPDLISAGISADGQNNPFYVISAAEQDKVPAISGYGISAWKDAENNEYKVSAHIIGNHGVSAAYDAEANTWNLGISANDYAFLFGSYVNNADVTDGTILKLESNNKRLINIDEDGYITLPSTTNKFTFCINEYVDDNTTENHEYLLNKLVLSAKDNDPLVTSQNYYPSEVGSSNVTIAITVDNTAAADREFCVVYKGSNVGTNKLHINASIIEEVTSLDSTAGSVDDYTGINPIYVIDNDRQIGLGWDETVFKLTEADELGRRKLTIDAGSETVDAKKFEKMAELIDTRMTETFPIGLVCDEGTIGGNTCVSYMFRPNMTYDCTSATSAYIYNGTVDENQVFARIGIYELEDTDATLVWKSALTCLKANSQNIFSAASDTVTGAISTDKLYYACILTNNKQINDILGINGNGTADVGNPKPWCTVNNINGTDKPFANTDFSESVTFASFGSFTSTIKPYIGLRGAIQ